MANCDKKWQTVTKCDRKWQKVTNCDKSDKQWQNVTNCEKKDEIWQNEVLNFKTVSNCLRAVNPLFLLDLFLLSVLPTYSPLPYHEIKIKLNHL